MSKVYKSVKGKMVDMDKVKLANESVTAVGNMRVNARGDLLGTGGSIAQGRNAIMDQVYAVESAPYSPNDPAAHDERQSLIENNKAKELHDLATTLVNTNPEPAAPAAPATAPARGSLAGSVAKPVTVTQEAMPDPRKPKGPSRI
jgi:hypothetical protein